MTLYGDFITNDARELHKWKHYFPPYERHFSPFINRSVVFIEIGVNKGGSLQFWKRYFGPHANIIGIDINPHCKDLEEDQVSIRIGNQADPGFLQSILDEFGSPDVVLDDGSHIMAHTLESFRFLYPRMTKNGVYLVEDMHTSYWPEFQGGVRQEGSFIEVCKGLIDELNADHTRGVIQPSWFTKSTLSMHFYDSLVVFERGTHTVKTSAKYGAGRKRPGQ